MSAMLLRKSALSKVQLTSSVSRRALVVRSANESPAEPSTSASEAGISGVSVQATTPATPPTTPVAVAATTNGVSFFDAMSFSNPVGPETINGRLAMLGLFAAIGAEVATGESFFTQFSEATPVVLATWAIISVASLVPIMRGADPTAAFGPMTHTAEMANGRAAMMGLAALLIIELTKEGALF
jgi:hypothetical protein